VKFKQLNQLLIQVHRAELARLELDAAASAHPTEQAQLLVQSLSAELAKLETDAAACAHVTLPPGEHSLNLGPRGGHQSPFGVDASW
jgi:hypothetical protein